jgi:hypothetical protein
MKLKRLLAWAANNTLLLASIVIWVTIELPAAGNVATFLIWLYFVGTLLCSLDTKSRQLYWEAGRSVPAWADYCMSAGYILLLTARGHFVLATVLTVNSLLEMALFKDFEVK